MGWVTICQAAIGSICLTAGFISIRVWIRDRQSWPHFWFALAAFSVAAIGVAETMIMHATSPASSLLAQRWGHVPVFFYIIVLVWFTYTYLLIWVHADRSAIPCRRYLGLPARCGGTGSWVQMKSGVPRLFR